MLQPGDEVDYVYEGKIAFTGTVYQVENDTHALVRSTAKDGKNQNGSWLLKYLVKKETGMLKVGSRVISVSSYSGKGAGIPGTINVILREGTSKIGVEFDIHINGHDIDNNGKDGYCYFLHAEDLQRYTKISNSAVYSTKPLTTKIEKESTMKIEHKTFINGTNVAAMSLEDEIELLQSTEARIKELEALDTKTTKVFAEIERLKVALSEAKIIFNK